MEKAIIKRIEYYNLIYNKKTLSIERSSKKDIILVWPERENLKNIAEQLQQIVDFLKDVTGKSLKSLRKRNLSPAIIVGCTSDIEDMFWAFDKYFGNTVLLPWNCLCGDRQPIEACTHELVHPFLHMTEVGNWGDGICDFLRIAIVEKFAPHLRWEINGKSYEWKEFMRENVKNRIRDDWPQHEKALRLLKQFGGGSSSRMLETGGTTIYLEEQRLKNFIRPLLEKTNLELGQEIVKDPEIKSDVD